MPYKDPEKRKAFWRKRNAGRRDYLRAYRERNRETILEQKRLYYLANKDEILAKDRAWKKVNKHRFLKAYSKKSRQWQLKQKSLGMCMWCGKPSGGFTRCEKHRKWFREYGVKYRKRNLPRSRELARQSAARRLANPNQKLAARIRAALRYSLQRNETPKTKSALVLLGCSLSDFRIYIESKFEVGMAWNNWGNKNDQWNLDHIMPIALFDLSKESHQKRCFHFSNYQPLWRPQNYEKGIKAPNLHQFRLL